MFNNLFAWGCDIFQNVVNLTLEGLEDFGWLFFVLLGSVYLVEAGDVGNVSVENVVDVDSFEVRMGFKLFEWQLFGGTWS